MIKIKYSSATVVGGRANNQDVLLADTFISAENITDKQTFDGECVSAEEIKVFAICDGVGMYTNSGCIARVALEAVDARVKEYNSCVNTENVDFSLRDWVIETIEAAKKSVSDYCLENDTAGSSTISLLAIRQNEYVFANIGDSPGFLLNGGGSFSTISFSHTLASLHKMLDSDVDPAEEGVLLYHLNDRTQSVADVVNITQGTLNDNDAFLVCSDGVFDIFGEDEIKNLLNQKADADVFTAFADAIIDADNCTAIAVYVHCGAEDTACASAQENDEKPN